MSYLIVKDPPVFKEEIYKIEKEDYITADLENEIKGALLNNDVYLKKVAETIQKKANEHIGNGVLHVTAEEKKSWSEKAGTAVATQTANGLQSAADKKKLDEVATGAEVNQNAFSKITSGNVTISANTKEATLVLQAGSNVTVSADNATKKVTISAERDGGNAATLGGHNAAYFSQASHTHDDRYYTQTEVTNLLKEKAAASHTHSYLALSGGTLTGNLKVNTTLNSVNYQENGVVGHLVYVGSSAPSNTNMVWID